MRRPVHGTGNKPNNSQVDVSLIYGDYDFTEALLRYLDATACPWDVNEHWGACP